MSASTLEEPKLPEELYLSTGADVNDCRPILTGDVFENIQIPGLEAAGLAIVLTHPCSMRRDGVTLSTKLLMAEVANYQAVPLKQWSTGHFRVMPLPGLDPHGPDLAVLFDNIGLVESNTLASSTRAACLSPNGINLLQQRLIWYLTRFAVPTFQLNEACAAVFEEADLCEEWVSERTSSGRSKRDANVEFHEWIRAPGKSGEARQVELSDPQRRAVIRRTMREEL